MITFLNEVWGFSVQVLAEKFIVVDIIPYFQIVQIRSRVEQIGF